MITFNGLQFAKNNKELTDSLFNKGGTVDGFYKKLKHSINLYKLDGTLFASLIWNNHGKMVVSACTYNGKPRYLMGLSSVASDYLGLTNVGLTERNELLTETWQQLQ